LLFDPVEELGRQWFSVGQSIKLFALAAQLTGVFRLLKSGADNAITG